MQSMNGSNSYLHLTLINRMDGLQILCVIDKNLTAEEVIKFQESIAQQCNKSSGIVRNTLSIKSSSRNEFLSLNEPIYKKFHNSISECFEIYDNSSVLDTELQNFEIKVRQILDLNIHNQQYVIKVSRHDTLQQVSEQIQLLIINRQRSLELIIKGKTYDPQVNNMTLAELYIIRNDEIQFKIKQFQVKAIDGQKETIMNVEYGQNRTLLDIEEEIINNCSKKREQVQIEFFIENQAYKGKRLEIPLSQLNIHANVEIPAKFRHAGGYQK